MLVIVRVFGCGRLGVGGVLFLVLEVWDLVGAGALLLRDHFAEIDARSEHGGVLAGGDLRISEVEFGLAHLRTCFGQRQAEFGGIGRAVLRVLRRRPQHKRVQTRAEAGNDVRRRRNRVVDVTVGDLDRHIVGIGLSAGEHLVEHDADRVQIGTCIGAGSGDELGSDIADGADEGLRRRRRGHGTGQTEVGELDLTVGAQQHIVGLEITVDDPCRMHGLERGEDRVEDDDRLSGSEGAAVLELTAQRHRGQVLHDEVDDVAVTRLIVDGHEVRVGEATGVDRLPAEAFDEGVIGDEVLMHDLDRDLTIETQIGAAVDHGHTAAGDLGIDAVAVVEHRADEGISAGVHRASFSRARCIWTPRTKAFVSGSSPSARTERRSW